MAHEPFSAQPLVAGEPRAIPKLHRHAELGLQATAAVQHVRSMLVAGRVRQVELEHHQPHATGAVHGLQRRVKVRP